MDCEGLCGWLQLVRTPHASRVAWAARPPACSLVSCWCMAAAASGKRCVPVICRRLHLAALLQVLQDDASARQRAKQAAAAKKAACKDMLEQQMADNTYRR